MYSSLRDLADASMRGSIKHVDLTKNVHDFLQRTTSPDEQFDKIHELTNFINDSSFMANPEIKTSLADSMVDYYVGLADRVSHDRLETMRDDLRDVAKHISDGRCNAFGFAFQGIAKRDLDLLKIPHRAHWFFSTGKGGEGNDQRSEISDKDLRNIADFAHLHPKDEMTLWTDDVWSLTKSIESLGDGLGPRKDKERIKVQDIGVLFEEDWGSLEGTLESHLFFKLPWQAFQHFQCLAAA